MRAKPPYDGTGAALIFKPTYNWFTKRIPARPGHAFATAPINTAALRQLCLLSEQQGFRVNLVWPPLVAEIEAAMVASGALAQLEENIRSIVADHCHVDEIFDFNRIRTYTVANFHRDMVHLFGEGWEQRYVSDLRKYLNDLPE